MFPIFDGHNDVLARLWLGDETSPAHAFLHKNLTGQMDFRRCRLGGFVGGLFAVFVPPADYIQKNHPNKIGSSIQEICFAQIAYLLEIERESEGRAKLCKTVADIEMCIEQDVLAMVMHIEGADLMDDHFHLLDILHQAGLRSVGALWNTPNQFGCGLQADFPHSPNTGAGLTALGKAFIARCEQNNIVVDVSHMNERAFWDTARLLSQPLVATHSNVHHLCPQARNLTNRQLEAIASSDGFVGVNFDTAFLRADGQRNANTPICTLIEHLEYLLKYVGEDGVGFGSDYDGGFMSAEWASVEQISKIPLELQRLGYSEHLIEKICYKNWLGVLKKIWKA